MKLPLPLALASAGWIAATGFTAVFGFGAGAATTWLICGTLAAIFGLSFLYLGWEFRRAATLAAVHARAERPRVSRSASPPRGVPIFDRIQPTTRLTISARSAARQIRRSRGRESVAIA